MINNFKDVVDGEGNLVNLRRYRAFGEEQVEPESGFGYTSREYDDVTGLYYYRSRFYDPQLGRFIQRDKFNEQGYVTNNPDVIFNSKQINDYAYVGNNPVKYVDPYGTDIYIYYYTNEHGSKYTHVALSTDKEWLSFYPKQTGNNLIKDIWNFALNFINLAESEYYTKEQSHSAYSNYPEPFKFKLNGFDEEKINDWIKKRKKLHPKYGLFGNNCAQEVFNAMKAGINEKDKNKLLNFDLYNALKPIKEPKDIAGFAKTYGEKTCK